MIYLIISKDGRTFFDDNEPEDIIKNACVPIKAIFTYDTQMKLVWSEEDNEQH